MYGVYNSYQLKLKDWSCKGLRSERTKDADFLSVGSLGKGYE